jgi:ferrous iron transport protein B
MGAANALEMKNAEKDDLVIAVAGNPNSGKTTIFNSLTGAHQHVGNWPGVTVEKKEGRLLANEIATVVDLPGIYSLGAYSEDEVIARNFILYKNPDVVINVVDASNLERNLYLTMQLLEMNSKVIVALNMYDEAEAKQIEIDVAGLSELLGIPVVPTVAPKNNGIKELIERTLKLAAGKKERLFKIDYGKEIEEELGKMEAVINTHTELSRKYLSRWLAVKMLEGDELILDEVEKYSSAEIEKLFALRAESIKRLESAFGEDIESIFVEKRYGFIGGLVKKIFNKRRTVEERLSNSDKIDKVVLNRYLGIPLLLLAMWGMFQFTFTLGDPLIGYMELIFEWLGEALGGVIANQILSSLLVDGIIGGVGSVLVFIPPIFLLFFAISLLEDSGYMARVAYIMDRFMHGLGLHGKSFIPMLIGFGCNVPAIMATRTLENKKDRLITILINPLMSCAARMPVYVLFAGAFFAANQGLVIFSLYLIGIVLAVVMGKIFKTFLFPGDTSPFVMELPPYRVPTLKGTFIHMWERGSSFVRKAGTIIFAVVILIWVLSSFPWGVEYASRQSLLGNIGSAVAPLFKPLGFGTWEAASALIFGLLAKEVVVGTLGVIYGAGEVGLTEMIRQMWTPLSAYAFMVMTLIYIPCIATIGAIKRETNSWKWTGFAVGYSLLLGWLMGFIVYQGGKLLGLG